MRLSVPCLRDNPARVLDLRRRLAGLEGIEEVSPSTTTGNLVVCYDPRRLTTQQVLCHLFPHCEIRRLDRRRPEPPHILRGLLAARGLVKAAGALAGGRRLLTPGFGLVWLVLDLLAREG